MGSIPFAILLVVAFRGGGADLVARQEMSIFLLWGIALAVAFGVLPRARPSRALGRVMAFGLLFFALTALSATSTESIEQSAVELARVVAYGGIVVLIAFGLSSRSWRAAAAGLAAAALVVPVAAVLSRLVPDVFNLFGVDTWPSRRLLFPLGYWNAIGAWSAMALAIAVTYSVSPRAGGWRVAALSVTPWAGVAIYLTYSRGAILAALVGLVVSIYLSRDRRSAGVHAAAAVLTTAACVFAVRGHPEVADGSGDSGSGLVLLSLIGASVLCGWVATRSGDRGFKRGNQIGRWGPAIVVSLGGAAVVAALAIGGAGATAQPSADPRYYPTEGADPAARLASLDTTRYEIWASGARAFSSDPLTGIGAGSFGYWWNRDGGEEESLRDAHSLYIEVAAELGVFGVVSLLAFLGTLLFAAAHELRRSRSTGDASALAAMVSAFVVFLVVAGFDWLWEIPAISIFGLGAAGIAAASGSSPDHRRSRLSWARVAAVAAAILAGVVQIPSLVATQRVRASTAELVVGDYAGAEREATEAIQAEPWAATPYAQRALAKFGAEEIAGARSDVQSALDREETNWKHWFLLSQVYALQGDTDRTLKAIEEARELSPLPDTVFDEAAARALAASAFNQPFALP